MVLDQTLKAIAHFLVRPKDVHASAVGKDDLGGVRATVRSLYLHDVSHVEQRGAGACFEFNEHNYAPSLERASAPWKRLAEGLFDGDPDQHRHRPEQKAKGDPRVKYGLVLRWHRARSILRFEIENLSRLFPKSK
jgi:hypothetical protein